MLASGRSSLLFGIVSMMPMPAIAQATGSANPAVSGSTQANAATPAKRVYTPADFARFAPKTAYDMLAQVPSFSIQTVDTSTRGLGQASENVLINGQRITNKSGGAVDQLQRTTASNVERIEIVDAASLGIAGLSGQVANVVLKQAAKASGQFEWDPTMRAHYAKPEFIGGSVSYSGKSGPVDYTLSARNGAGRGAFGGPVLIFDRNGVLTESRNEIYHGEYEEANLQAKLALRGPGSSVGNLTLGYTPYWSPSDLRDRRILATGEIRHRTNVQKTDGYIGDINGDYEFALGPGRLKLIGLTHWEHNPLVVTQVLRFDTSGAAPQGSRFDRDTHTRETIGRAEYHWKIGKNDWQFSFERAFNSLDQVGRLFDLNDDDQFVALPFPEGTGKVIETRYEALATLSRPLTSNLNVQIAAGAETSTLGLVGAVQRPRQFFRPKGSIDLGWHLSKTWDVNVKLRRRVGQIDFSDFLSQAVLSQDRTNAGNVNLVPPQSWEFETEFAHDLGRWGKTRLNLHYYRVEDIVDVNPIGRNGQGIGNLPHADRFGFESNSTLLLDPIHWTGAKLDLTVGAERTRVRDPLTGDNREISGVRDRWGSAQVRHDIPHTPFAWSAYVQYNHYARNYFLTEVFRALDLPWIAGVYFEDKNVRGLTVRFSIDNVFNGRHLLDRTVFDGFRDRAPVLFVERHNQLVGPLFRISVKGAF
ncbi:MAG: TonB-dependent receptor [Alphaproteobacteria bacterium]|nr:TonB-dependent receptor [Alphaproteobacteria bacterium]